MTSRQQWPRRRRLHWVCRIAEPGLAIAVADLRRKLADAGLEDEPDARRADAVVVWADEPLPVADAAALAAGDLPLVLAGPTLHVDREGIWTRRTGVVTGPVTPPHDIRVRPGPTAGSMADRLSDHEHSAASHVGPHTHVLGPVLTVAGLQDGVDTLLEAAVGLTAHGVAMVRPSVDGHGGTLAWSLGTTAEAVRTPGHRRLFTVAVQRLLDARAGTETAAPTVRVGLLGFGAIGDEHASAVSGLAGLELSIVCDRDPGRLKAASNRFPAARTTTDPHTLIDGSEVDLVVVSTPPDSHAAWALAAARAGKHVVVEKPFAIRTAEADEVLEAADRAQLIAVVYQNRRFDPDHVAVTDAVRSGRLGDVFHIETFVGGYGHPCNLWHSDQAVSGGAMYDWGAHVLDQVLDIVPAGVRTVTASTQKRRWFDVTNADHSRVTLAFEDGTEAQFVYSDLAAAMKPRWYVLGTEGAIVGHWRTERVVTRNAVGTLAEDVLAPADSPPLLDLHTPDGSVTRMATPPVPRHPFHRELADRLLLGMPMSVSGATSRRVLSVMEAAAASAAAAGSPVTPR